MGYFRLQRAASLLRNGGIIAYPTEAVFGLGCDPANEAAVRRILVLKQRPVHKGLILIAACFEQLSPWLKPLSGKDFARIKTSWPGPVTWLLPARPGVPVCLRGEHDTLAVRVTAHPLAAALCRAAAMPLVSTSANIAARPPARKALTVRRYFGDALDAVIVGKLGGADRPSEIRDLNERLIRA